MIGFSAKVWIGTIIIWLLPFGETVPAHWSEANKSNGMDEVLDRDF